MPRGQRCHRDAFARLIAPVAFLVASAHVACSRPPEASQQRDSATARSSGDEPENQPPADDASGFDLSHELGQDTIDIVASADRILVADLTLVAADEALDPRVWVDPDRIAGYPIVGTLQPLDPAAASTVRELILSSDNYDPDWRWRCRMQRVIGIRFIRGTSRVDAALTDPCWLMIWTFERDTVPVRWSAAMSMSESTRIYRLVRPGVALE